MTGVTESAEPGTLVIEHAEYICDDGSQAEVLSGPPLEEPLRAWIVYDSLREALHDSVGLEWTRGEVAPLPGPGTGPEGIGIATPPGWRPSVP